MKHTPARVGTSGDAETAIVRARLGVVEIEYLSQQSVGVTHVAVRGLAVVDRQNVAERVSGISERKAVSIHRHHVARIGIERVGGARPGQRLHQSGHVEIGIISDIFRPGIHGALHGALIPIQVVPEKRGAAHAGMRAGEEAVVVIRAELVGAVGKVRSYQLEVVIEGEEGEGLE